MSYALDIDPSAHDQIAALPGWALVALAEAFTALQLVPWTGAPYHRAKPDGAMRTLSFGSSGVITYLVVEDRQRVDVLVVTWQVEAHAQRWPSMPSAASSSAPE